MEQLSLRTRTAIEDAITDQTAADEVMAAIDYAQNPQQSSVGEDSFKIIGSLETIEIGDSYTFNWWGDPAAYISVDGLKSDPYSPLIISSKDVNEEDDGSSDIVFMTGANLADTTGSGFGSGDMWWNTGDVASGTKKSGRMGMTTGITDSAESGPMSFMTGGSNTGPTGNLTIGCGLTGGIRGKVIVDSYSMVLPMKSSAPASPVEGEQYYDSTLHKGRIYDGTLWQDLW